MKIVSWNINCKFRKKYKEVSKLNVDIYVSQGSEPYETCKDKTHKDFLSKGFDGGLGETGYNQINMKRLIIMMFAVIATATSVYAQNIELPSPQKNGGLPINRALAERHSEREFSPDKSISLQTVSDLLWAACGINRDDKGLRTNPTARNFQEVDAYWFDSTGVYLYDFKDNALIQKAKGDHRSLVAGTSQFKQDFVLDAPASIVLVADTTKAGLTCALIDAGIACENINLFCTGNGLATVPRMTMDVNGIQQLLSLPETSLPVLNNPVGYSK